MSETATIELIDKLRTVRQRGSWTSMLQWCEQSADLIESKTAEIERLRDEICGCLDLIRLPYRVLVREGGGYQDESKSLAVSVSNLADGCDQLRQQLADAERQRDQAVALLRVWLQHSQQLDQWPSSDSGITRRTEHYIAKLAGTEQPERETSSGEEPSHSHEPAENGDSAGLSAASVTAETPAYAAAESTWGDAIANMAVKPMTGEQLNALIFKFAPNHVPGEWDACDDEWKVAMMKLGFHIWPNAQPQPDRREQLRQQVKRTDHGDNLVVLRLNGRHCVANGAALWDWFSVDTTAGKGTGYRSKGATIAAATEWLVDEALKTEGESC